MNRKKKNENKSSIFFSHYFLFEHDMLYGDIYFFFSSFVNRFFHFLLHKNGWKGINIDIHKFSIDLFNYLRPKDLNYNLAVSNKDEIIDMYYQKELKMIKI